MFSIAYLGTKPPITIERAASGKARNSVLGSSDTEDSISMSEDSVTRSRSSALSSVDRKSDGS